MNDRSNAARPKALLFTFPDTLFSQLVKAALSESRWKRTKEREIDKLCEVRTVSWRECGRQTNGNER